MSGRVYTVTGQRLISVTMKVIAASAGEAIEKAKSGDYFDSDTEPMRDLYSPPWTARPAYRPSEKPND